MRTVCVLLFFAILISGAGSALADSVPVQLIDGHGILLGARNINIGGSLYDVDFRDGTCAELFNCGSSTPNFLLSLDQIISANTQLMTYVFTDSSLGLFNSHPESTFGCGPISREAFPTCYIVTPFSSNPFSASLEGIVNHGSDEAKDAISVAYLDNNASTVDMPLGREMVYAIWRPHPVPEPSSFALLGFGIALITVLRNVRRKETLISK